MNTKPLYIFDLDGTLALINHRRHFVENPAKQCCTCFGNNSKNCVDCGDMGWDKWKPDWPAFHAACVDDKPNWPVIGVLNALRRIADIRIFSGRSDEVRIQTMKWLNDYLPIGEWDVRMRQAGDYTPDDVLKRQWYADLPTTDQMRLVAVFDDRDRIVKMWRSLGITCMQVAPGDF